MPRQPSLTLQVLRQNRLWISRFLAVFMALWQIGQPLQAATFYWDTDASDTGNVIDGTLLGGTAAWDTTASNWWPVPAGSLTIWGNTSSDTAIFTGPAVSIPTLNTVTLASGITANQVRFNRSGYTLTDGNLTLAGTVPTIYASIGESATIASQLSGTAGLTVSGGGSFRLTNVLNNYSGTTTISNGSLVISNQAALGADTSAIVVAGSATRGFGGGSLVLDGTSTGLTFTRDLSLQGLGPISDRSSALISVGNNTLTGTVAISQPTSGTNVNTRITSGDGMLNFSSASTFNVLGAPTTTISILGGTNQTGAVGYNLAGTITGPGTYEKTGAGTLFLNPTNVSGFSGTIRVTSNSVAGTQGTLRITNPNVIGSRTNASTGASSIIDLNAGFLELRMNTPSLQNTGGTNANVYSRSSTNATFFVDHGLGGSAVNQTLTLGEFGFAANASTTFASRNGYNIAFGAAPVVTGDNSATITNSMAGTLSFTGAFWSNANNTAARTMTIAGNGNTLVSGNITASSAAFDHILTKSGSGSLTVTSTGSTLDGAVNVQGGALRITDFRSITNNTSTISLGNATTTGGNLIIGTGTAATVAGLTTSKPIQLNTTTAGNSIYANQTGSNPVVLNGAVTKIAAATTGNLILGGTNTADNIINVPIPVESTPSTGGLVKLGTGTWVLNSASTYAGPTTINAGTLKLNATAAASDTIKSAASNTVVFAADATTQSAGGTLQFTGFSGAATTEDLGILTPTLGAGNIIATANGGATTLKFTSLGTRAAGATLGFVPGTLAGIQFGTTAPTGLNGQVGGFAYISSPSGSIDFVATPALNTNLAPLSAATALPAATGSSTTNYINNAALTQTAAVAANTLRIVGSGQTIAQGGFALTVTNTSATAIGGILFDNGAGAATISGGSIVGSAANEIIVITGGAATGGAIATNTLTINSTIGAATASGLTKSGTGRLIIGGNNAYTGNNIINEGYLQLAGATATLGINSVAGNQIQIRQGATLDINAAGVSNTINVGALVGAGVITNSGGGTSTAGTIALGRSTSTTASTFSGVLQNGAGVLNVSVDGTSARIQSLLGQSTYTGVTTINTASSITVNTLADGGTASGIGQSSNAASNLVFNGASPTLVYQGNIRDGSLNLGSASASTDRLFTISGAGAVLSSTVSNGNAVVWSNTGAIVHGTNAARTLTLTGTSTGDNTFNPQFTDSVGFVSSLSKTGAGQWNLGSSTSSYTGTTNIAEGILGLNNNSALPANSPLVFSAGATATVGVLQMSGTFERNLAATATAGTGTVTWGSTSTGGGGFAAHTTPLVVAIGGVTTPTALTWGSGGFVGTGGVQALILSSASALSDVDFRNPIDLGASQRTVTVNDNANTAADYATLSGVLSGAGGLVKNGAGMLKLTGANTYAGVTDVNAGTIIVTSLGNSATPGATSLGNSALGNTNAGAITLGNAGTGGAILQYVGPGETSDRKIRFNATTGAPQIHADGSGPLILTNVANDFTTPTGAKTLTLRGSNTANNMITSALTNDAGGGALGVIVDGGATWILTGANTYTGTTAVGAGGFGIASNTLGSGAGFFDMGSGTIFGYQADRVVTNPARLQNNTTPAFVGEYSLDFSANPLVNQAGANNTAFTNNIISGKTLTFGAMTVNSMTAGRTMTINGTGDTIISGNITTSTAFDLNFVYSGTGSLTLGGTGNDWSGSATGGNLTVSSGTLRLANSEVIPNGAGNGNLIINPATTVNATFNLNGNSETVNALTANSAGNILIDNTSASPVTLTLGDNNGAVAIGGGGGSYTISNSGGGALSLTKTGTAAATISTGVTLSYLGATTVNGGSLTVSSAVNGTSSLAVTGTGSLLALNGGITVPTAITSVNVDGGATLNLLDGAGNKLSALTSLTLGSAGGTNTTLGLNVGDLNVVGDNLNTDTMSLTALGTLTLTAGNKITFNLTDTGLNPGQTYVLLDATNIGGGFTSGALSLADYLLGATPGGFTSISLSASTNNQILLTTGSLITGSSYWRGLAGGGTDTTWNSNASNWSLDKTNTSVAASIPGQGTDVVFQVNAASNAAVSTTLEQNFKINSLTFEADTTPANTPTAITISPGTVTTNRLEISPQIATDGIKISAGGTPAVTISAPLRLGTTQTWNVADATSVLTLSGGLQGEADVTKTGSGRVSLTTAAASTFNTGLTTDFTINGGTLEATITSALGTTANNNLARINIGSGGGFYYNNATAGTMVNPIRLSGGTLSAAGNGHTYSAQVNVTANSTINMRNANSAVPTDTQRNITLSGGLTGTGNLTLDSINTVGTGNQLTGTLTINQDNSTFTGNWNVLRGTIATNNVNGLGLGTTINMESGRISLTGVNSATWNLAQNVNIGSATTSAVGEIGALTATGFTLNLNGVLTLGGAGGFGELRGFVGTDNNVINLNGGVTLANDGRINAGGAAVRLVNVPSIISETGGARSLRINDTLWGTTYGIVRLTAANTFTGNFSLGAGTLEYNTVTDAGGAASSLGQGNAITMDGGTLRFIGTSPQSTNRPITTATGVVTLSANGATAADTISYNGAITVGPTADGSQITLTGATGRQGIISGGITQTGDTADITVSGGTWTHQTGTSRIGDDVTLTGTGTILNLNSGLFQVRDDFSVTAGAVLNLNGTSALSFNITTLSADASLRAFTTGTINLGANNAIVATEFDGLRIGTDGAGVGTLNMGAFNQNVTDFILGNRNIDRSGVVNGSTGVLTATTNIDLYGGTVQANLGSTGAVSLDKLSMNTVTLSGDNSALAGTGITLVEAGTLILDYSGNTATKVNPTAQLDMRGSNLTLSGNTGSAVNQSVGSFTLATGGSNTIALNSVGQNMVLNLNAITRAVNSQDGTVRFVLPAGAQSASNGITTDMLNTLGTGVNAILGAWATVNDGTGVFYARNLTNAVDGNIVAAVTTLQDAVGSWVTGDNVSDSAGFSGSVSGIGVNSLRLNAASGSDLSLGASGALGVNSGGILVTSSVGSTPSIVGGTLFSGNVAATPELIVAQDSASVFDINADIRTNHQVFKTGTGTLLLSGNNTYSGVSEIQEGTLQVSGGTGIGDTSAVTLSATRASTFQLLGNETIGRLAGGSRQADQDLGVVAIGANTLTLNQNAASTYSGLLTGTGTIVKNGLGFDATFNNISPGFTGTLRINQGGVVLSGIGAISVSSIEINKTGYLRFQNTSATRSGTRIPDATPITLNSADGSIAGQTVVRGLFIDTDQNAQTSETIGQLIFNSGASYLSGNATGTTGIAVINAENFVRNNNATVIARGRAMGSTASVDRNLFRIMVGTANETAFLTTVVGGGGAAATPSLSIVPWAIGETLTANLVDANMGNSLVTYGSGIGFRALDFATEYSTIAAAAATHNARESLTADLTAIAGTTLNSLVLNNNNVAAANVNVTGSGAGQTLAVTSGAMLFTLNSTAAAGAYSTNLGGFDSGITTTAGANPEYVIHVVNPSSAAGTASLTATISSPLTSTASITKSGRGTLILSGNNTAGGGIRRTTINEGILEIADLDNIGGNTGALVFAGGTLRLGTTLTDDISTRTISFLNGGGTIDTNTVNLTLANNLGTGSGSFTKAGAGNLTLNAASTRTGSTTVSGGTLTVGVNNAIGSGDLTVGAGATLALGSNNVSVGSVTTSGLDPVISGTGTISSTTGFSFNNTDTAGTTIAATLAGAAGLLKTQTNVLTLSAANTYTGLTEIQNGTVSVSTIGNVGGGASGLGAPVTAENGIIRMGLVGTTGTLNYTGSGHTTDRLIGLQGSTGGAVIDADGTGALIFTSGARTENTGAKSLVLRGSSAPAINNIMGEIREIGAGLTLNKADSNTWLLSTVNTYSGATQVDEGTLKIGVANSLPTTTAVRVGTGTTVGVLDLNGFNQTVASLTSASNSTSQNSVLITPGTTLTTGSILLSNNTDVASTNMTMSGGGALVVNGTTITVGNNTAGTNFSSKASLNLAALSSFTAILSGNLTVQQSGDNSTADNASLILSDTANNITTPAVIVGGSSTGSVNTLTLGAGTNVINANLVHLGSGTRDTGVVSFAGANGSVTLRNAAGTGRANVTLGVSSTQGTGYTTANNFDVTGHTADLAIATLATSLGAKTAANTNDFKFNQGTLDILSINMAAAKGTGASVNKISIGGGTTLIGGSATFSDTGTGTATLATAGSGELEITGGAVTSTVAFVRGVGTGSATVTLNGGTLNMSSQSIGTTALPITLTAASGTLNGLSELNGGGALTKTTTGTLIMGAGNAYTGATNVSDGTLQVGVAGVGTTGTGLITAVKTGATYANAPIISGSGTLQGATIIGDIASTANKGILAPGDGNTATSNAKLTITAAGGLTIAAGSQTQLGITAASGTDSTFAASGMSASAYLASLGSTSDASLTTPAAWANQATSSQADFINVSNGTGALVLGTNLGGAAAGQGIVSIFSNGLNTGTLAAGQIFNLVDWFGAFSGGFSAGIGTSTGGIHGDFDLPDISMTTFGWDTSAFTSHGVIAVVVVPEPSRALLMLIGLLAFGFRRRRIQD